MRFQIRLRRLGYRLAYRLLRIYWFLARPAVTGVKGILTDGQNVLLVRHTYGTATWDFPGGTIKRREPPLTAIRREMEEELGITNTDWRPLGEVHGRMHHRQDTLVCFTAELRAPALTLDLGELAVARWFPRDQLPPDVGRYVRPILELMR